jgi:hypothetical protein
MKKIVFLFLILSLTVSKALAQTPTPTAPTAAAGGHEAGDYFGIGGGLDLPIQNAGLDHHGVLTLVSGRPLIPQFVGEGEFDGMVYSAGSGGLLDMRLFATAKFLPDLPFIFIQPYGLAGFGFAGLLGIDANTPNLVSLDFVWGAGFRVELVRRTYLFLDWKMQILVRDYPAAIDSPLTGGILFPL